MEPADRVAPSRGDKSRTDTQDAQGLCVAAHDSVPLHALKANNVGSVEKPADEEPSGRRFLEWVVRHAGWARSESIQPVAKTGIIRVPEWKDGFDTARHERRLYSPRHDFLYIYAE